MVFSALYLGGALRVRVHEIRDQGSLHISEDVPASSLPLEMPDNPALVGPARVNLQAQVDGDEIWGAGSVAARVSLSCARCLARFEADLSAVFDTRIPSRETYLDVDDDVRQSLLLALPAKPLCRADCRGLCPRCGRNLNQGACGCSIEKMDSPFVTLKKLIP